MFPVFGMMEGNLVSNRQLPPWCLQGEFPLCEVRWQKDFDGFLMLLLASSLLELWNKARYSIALGKCSSSQATLKEVNLAETFYKNEISTLYLACIECPWNAEIIWQGFILWLLMIKLNFYKLIYFAYPIFLIRKLL